MRFLNYINEEYWSSYIDSIKRDCKPFLKDFKTRYHKNFLWSGRNYSGDFDKKQVRQNRAPKDTPLELHFFVDNWFYKKFGIKARSQTVFAISDFDIADDYGELYAIFPIGNYKTITSARISDIWMHILDEMQPIQWNGLSDSDKQIFLDDVEEKLEKANYQLNKFYHDREIMIYCKEYYLLHYHNIIKSMSRDDFII